MKLFKSTILAMLAFSAVTMVSCDGGNDVDYVEGAQSTGAYFPTTTTTYTLDRNKTSFAVPVARNSKDAPSTVQITVSDPSGLFGIPSQVTFADGELTAEMVITYDPAELTFDEKYSITAVVDGGDVYGNTDYTFTAVLPAPWKKLGTGLYTDALVCGVYTISQLTYSVEIEENEITPGLYRVKNPYGVNVFAYTEPADMTSTETYYMYVHAEKPDQVWMEELNTHMNYGAGVMTFTCRAALLLTNPANTIEMIAAAGYCGKNNGGILTMPDTFYFTTDDKYSDGWYGPLSSTGWRLVLPGVSISDYSAEISYTGRFTDTEGQNYICANVNLGDDVKVARVAAAVTSNSSALKEAIENDEIDYVEVTSSGEVKIPIDESGVYMIMVVTYGDGKAQEVASEVAEITLGGKQWEDMGDAYIMDGWLLGSSSYYDRYQNMMWKCPIQRSTTREGIYRLVEPYGPNSLLGNFAEEGIYNIEINASDVNDVYIEPQYTGCAFFSNGTAWIATDGAFDDLPDNLRGTLEDGVIIFPATTCLLSFNGQSWYFSNVEGGILIESLLKTAGANKSYKSVQTAAQVGSAKQRMKAVPYKRSRALTPLMPAKEYSK